MSVLGNPDLLARLLWVYGYQAVVNLSQWFDTVFTFAVCFAFFYGLASFVERLVPTRPGARPRFWLVPFVFLAVAVSFPLFLDLFVALVLQVAIALTSLFYDTWVLGTVACVWAVGLVYNLVATIRGLVWLRRMVRALPDAPDNPTLRAAMAAVGLDRSVGCKLSAPGTDVFSCGLRRRFIVVPEDFASRYTDDEQYAILLHECIHLNNGDVGLLLWLSVIQAVLWFDPVSRHAAQRMRADLELLCDWTAVHIHRLEAEPYAGLIVAAVASPHRPAPAFSDGYRLLASRLGVVLSDPDLQPSRMTKPLAAALSILMAAFLVFAVAIYRDQVKDLPARKHIESDGQGGMMWVSRHGAFATFARGVKE